MKSPSCRSVCLCGSPICSLVYSRYRATSLLFFARFSYVPETQRISRDEMAAGDRVAALRLLVKSSRSSQILSLGARKWSAGIQTQGWQNGRTGQTDRHTGLTVNGLQRDRARSRAESRLRLARIGLFKVLDTRGSVC